jgi:multicomponent Na+:H+ antiporter subunit B
MKGMSLIVQTVTRIIAGVIFIYGIYIITHGHLTPGGGFAGGAIIAGAFILLVLSYGSDKMKLSTEENRSSFMESISVFTFLILAILGFFLGTKVFFNNFIPIGIPGELVSAGNIPLMNVAVGIEVAAALFTIFLALIIYKEEVKR